MTANGSNASRSRERSARYPGVDLGESIDFCRRIDQKGADSLPAAEIAAALGYSNVRTNSFSARLSAARQFGLIDLRGESYTLTPRARSILHPVEAADLPRLHHEAFLEPPLYASLATRLAGRRVPEPGSLANLLYHQEQITAAAKRTAALAFLASARFAGAIGSDGVLRTPDEQAAPGPPPAREADFRPSARPSPVRIDLRLWGPDAGKAVRVRAPEAMTKTSFERLLAALRLHIRIEDDPPG
jgi:hypothetical protein